jgi:adenosylhomocysteine nucleosidase
VRRAFRACRERTYSGRRVCVARCGTREFWMIQTGIGHENAGQVANWWLQQQAFQLVISTGFACALVPATIGALLIGREVSVSRANRVTPSAPMQRSGEEQRVLWAFLSGKVRRDHSGPFISVDQIAVRASEKQAYARLTKAVGLDMESAALAMASQRAQVPFVILRTVSDLLEEDLPVDFNLFFRLSGWPKGIGSVLMAPKSWCGLRRLHRQSSLAAARLTQVFREYARVSAASTFTAEHA